MNKRRISVIACILFLLSVFSSALAAGRAECSIVKSVILGHAVNYCVLLPSTFDTNKTGKFAILYQLHGLGGSEQSLLETGWTMIDDLKGKKEIGNFIVVMPAAGSTFFVNSQDGHVRYEDFFIKEFIPYIESRYRAYGTRDRRGIGGISMGGYGALHYAFKYPQLFSVVTANSAALVEAVPSGALMFGSGTASPFGDPFDGAYWHANTPFTLARKAPVSLRQVKIYFDCGTNDDYNFEIGAQKLHEELTNLKIPHEFHLYPGSHDVAYFAQHLPASLKFQSRHLVGQ
jgi:S-formylglutathione hydrolase FrmB